MNISIVSDLHLGDEQCALVDNKTHKKTADYDKFRDAVGQGNDYLVLTGDILDFSVSLYQDTYECARTFFNQVLQDGLAKEFIYLPGNHDCNVWHTVEHQTNIINQMEPGQQVCQFRHSVPAILDDRKPNLRDKLELYGVTPQADAHKAKYGGLYLDKLIAGKSVFNVAHPNLYLVSDDGTGTLITHGHYFEQYWTLTSWLALAIARDDLAIGALDVNELVSINFPLAQLACTGIGQSGPLSPVINSVQKDVKSGELTLIAKYLARAKKVIDDYWDFERFDNWLRFMNVKEKLSDKLLDFMEEYIMGKVREISASEGGSARGNDKFQYQPDVQKRMGIYYLASLVELQAIMDDPGSPFTDLPHPASIVFGHTHRPIPWGDAAKVATLPCEATGGRIVKLLNCGGWLRDDDGDFCGANIFKYQTGQPGLITISVS